MRLRTKLILVFFLLAVVPLTGVTVYSYYSSQQALRRAVAVESDALAQDLQHRMENASGDITRRIERLREMPVRSLMAPQPGQPADSQQRIMMGQIMSTMGDAAPFIDSFEIQPMPPKQGDAPKPPAPPHPPHLSKFPPPPPPSPAARVYRFEMPGSMTAGNAEEVQRRALQIVAEVQKQTQLALVEAGKKQLEADRLRHETTGLRSQELELKLGQQFGTEIMQDGAVVAKIRAQIRARQLLRSVLSRSRRGPAEIPFALDADGKLHAEPADIPKLQQLHLESTAGGEKETPSAANWVVTTRKDKASGLTFGIAHPIGDQLVEIRRAAVKNLAYGLGMVCLAVIGIIPLSGRMTRNISVLTKGAEELARGNLAARVDIRSKDEIGQLAQTFNRMAEDIVRHEKNIVEQERFRRELELCRKIQEELLPHEAFRSGVVEARGVSIPAREVGGDFFNYFPLPDGEVALLIGDVSGKGLPAALMMANIQATLQARLPFETGLAELARQLDQQIGGSTPEEVYLTLFMGVLDTRNHRLRYVNAGHNTQFALHAGGTVERLESTGRPLGLLPGGSFEERSTSIDDGDCLFLYTDGLAEAENDAGEEFGLDRLEALLARDSAGRIDGVLERVESAVRGHRGGREAADDATMMLVRIGC